MYFKTKASEEALQRVAKLKEAQDWNRARERAHRSFHGHAESIAVAFTNGNSTNQLVRKFLRDPQVRMSAALRAIGGEPEQADAFGLRNRVNLWKSHDTPVFWYPKPKPNGDFRPICILPSALSAAHLMLAKVVAAQLPNTSTLFGVPRRGVADALREVKSLQSNGFVYLAKTDIVNCFQSINPEALYQLPLPQEVTKQTLDYRSLSFIGGVGQHASQASGCGPSLVYGASHSASGPQGLLQGSPASSIILAWLLQNIPTSDDARVFLCFDNIIVAARTPERTREMIETLSAYAETSPAGPLALCAAQFADNEPMEFLGGLLDPTRRDIGIAEKTFSRIIRRLCEEEEADQAELRKIWEKHQEFSAKSTIARKMNPYRDHFPTGIWHTLLDAAAGLPFLEADGRDLLFLLDTSVGSVEQRQDVFMYNLHQSLFSHASEQQTKILRSILRNHPRPRRRH